MPLHPVLKNNIAVQYAKDLQSEPVLSQDALTVSFCNGLVVELRYLNPDEYSIQWLWGEALLRIDTAPVHPHLATFPHHFHSADNDVKIDTLTCPGRDPWQNVRSLLDALLSNPLLS